MATTFDALVTDALKAHSDPEAAAGIVLLKYNTDPTARVAVNRFLALALKAEIARRAES